MDSHTALAARAYFPRGLFQPPGSFRFSVDALLLAAFVVRRCLPGYEAEHGAEHRAEYVTECGPKREIRVEKPALLDMGCGCGVAGLGCLLENRALACLGADCAPELVAAATQNAETLGLKDRFAASVVDFSVPEQRERIPPAAFAVAAANMPYRQPRSGRTPQNPLRKKALFAEEGTASAFMLTARRALAPGGALALIYPWETRAALFRALEEHGFLPDALLPVATSGEAPSLLLVRAQKGGGASLPAYEPPLVLNAPQNSEQAAQANAFCPWLRPRF